MCHSPHNDISTASENKTAIYSAFKLWPHFHRFKMHFDLFSSRLSSSQFMKRKDEAKGFIQRKWIKQTQRTIVKVHFSPRAWCALHFAGGSCIEPHILCMRINPQWNNIRYALHQLRFYDAFENILNFISLADFLLVLIINECNFKFKPLSSRRRSKNCKFQFNLHPHYNLWINFRMKFSAREICRRDPIDSLLKCTQNSTYY